MEVVKNQKHSSEHFTQLNVGSSHSASSAYQK